MFKIKGMIGPRPCHEFCVQMFLMNKFPARCWYEQHLGTCLSTHSDALHRRTLFVGRAQDQWEKHNEYSTDSSITTFFPKHTSPYLIQLRDNNAGLFQFMKKALFCMQTSKPFGIRTIGTHRTYLHRRARGSHPNFWRL